MSSGLAIAAVSSALRELLDGGLIEQNVTDRLGRAVTVTARAPDLITLGPDQAEQLNLFLFQVTPNGGWRNASLPSRDGGGQRIANPPLALDLHYLLTAYAATDLHAEIILGYGMQVLHETPGLSRDAKLVTYCAQMYLRTLPIAEVTGANEAQPDPNDGDASWIRGRN